MHSMKTTNAYKATNDRLFYLAIGGGIGAALALLFAPKPGNELRSDISEVTRKGYDQTVDLAMQVRDKTNGVFRSLKGTAEQLYENVPDELPSIVAAGEDLAHKARQAAENAASSSPERSGSRSHQGPGRRRA